MRKNQSERSNDRNRFLLSMLGEYKNDLEAKTIQSAGRMSLLEGAIFRAERQILLKAERP